MFIVMAGKYCGQERGELKWTLDDVIPESHTEILECPVIVTTVNGKLMGIGPVVFAKSIREAYAHCKFVRNSIIELLN
jgi:hypothetical protein